MVEVGKVTAIIDGDISGLRSALSQAHSAAVSGVSGIEADMRGKIGSGLSGAISGGKWESVGKNIGSDLVQNITAPFGAVGNVAGSVATALGPAGIIAVGATAGAAVVVSAASSMAMEWEAGMSQVSKTSGIQKGTEDFKALNSELKNLYSTMPTTVAEIQNVASAAGSLGIEKSSIAGFTEVALQMGSAFDMPAEEAAVSIGKVKSQLKDLPEGMDSAEFARTFGSAVDFAGNELNATERDVLDFSTRAAGAFSNLGGSAGELAGWGGEVSSVFSSSQLAAGSFTSAINNLMGTTKGSEAARAKAGELLGVTPDEFKELMASDPTDTLLDIGKAMEGLSDVEKFQAAGILGGGYGDDFFQKMVGKTDEWRQKIEEVNEAGQKGASIGTSYAAGADSAKAGFQVLKNSIGAILTDIGTPINAVAGALASGLGGALNSIRAIGENLWEPMTTALSAPIAAVSGMAEIIGGLGGMTLGGLVTATEGVNIAFQTGKAFVGAFQEEITKVITSSSTFQTIAGYIGQVTTAFSNLSSGASEVFDKVVSGLSSAIPTAVSGTVGALGTLADKAGLGGLVDQFEGVSGFLGDVYDNAAKKLGWTTEEAVGEGTKKGMEKGAEDAKGAMTKTLEQTAEEAFAAANDAYWKGSTAYGLSLSNQYDTGKKDASGKTIWKTGDTRIMGGTDITDFAPEYRGQTTIGGFEYKLSEDNALFLPDGTSYQLPSSMQGEYAKDLILDYMKKEIGRPLSELETAEIFGEIKTQVKLKTTVETVWGEYDTKALGDLIFDPDKLKGVVVDIDRFFDGTMIPEIEKKAEDAKAAWASGQVSQADIYDSFIAPMEKLSDYTPTWLENLNAEFKTGAIDIDTYNDRLDAMIGKNDQVATSAKDTQEAISGMFYGMTGESDKWQDYVNSEGGYIGPTKYYGGYAEDKLKDMQEAAAVNEKYGVAGLGSISQVDLSINTTQAKEDAETLTIDIENMQPNMSINLDTTLARNQCGELIADIEGMRIHIPVELSLAANADDLRSMIDSAIVDALEG